ncbi:MAG: trypsin-like peptidase domain-containing protein [Thermoleophilia bacterium]|nr:trypsin-like peptidase domain-containing protein [Thermoleophilia bacterium]
MSHSGAEPAGSNPARASRSIRRASLRIAVALFIVALVAVGPGACTFEFGEGSDTTVSTSTQSTPSTSAPTDTTTGGATSTTAGATATTGSTSVVDKGDGLASPAQTAGTILGPSVVNIKVTGTSSQGPFGSQQFEAEGSGVIYTADGMVITNNHVVTDNYGDLVDQIELTLTTGEKLSATVIGTDPLTDLAVVKVNAGFALPVATFVTEQPKVGEYAVAIGSPLGYENSVTLGIVSGLDRSIEGVYGTEGIALNNLIQTDAPISPGNSGGALANASGQVIGINVAYESPTSGAVNIGFAIPSAVVTKVADEIISTGRATHAYMGVGTRTVTSDLQRQFDLSRSSGILVAQVTPGGPAAKAGIQQGDIILKIDDDNMVESSDLLVAIRDRKPGDTVEVKLDRNGQEMVVTATLEERPVDY